VAPVLSADRAVLGIQLPIQAQSRNFVEPWEAEAGAVDLARIATAADRAGLGYVAVCDHVAVPVAQVEAMGAEWWDTVATLGWLAGLTERTLLVSHVAVPAYRHPLAVAKAFATLDVVSGGRAVLGVGAGHVEGEFAALGVPFEERGRLLDEAIDAVRACFASETPSHRGERWSFDGVAQRPRPVQVDGPPIWVGGSSTPAIRRAATRGDGWLPQGPLTADLVDAVRAALVAEAEITVGGLLRDVLDASAGAVVDAHGGPTWSGAGMDALVAAARAELRPTAEAALAAAGEVLVAAAEVRARLARLSAPSLVRSVADASAHLDRLVRPGFVASAGVVRLADVDRYVRGLAVRLAKLPEAPARDEGRMATVVPLERSYRDLLGALEPAQVTARVVEAGWLLEELRVGAFAQQLGTRVPVSATRIEAELAALWEGDL